MKKYQNTLLSVLSFMAISCVNNEVVTFDNFTYEGNDDVYVGVDTDTAYCNPVLAGYYPDPSICKKGDTYYLVNSSFAHFPIMPIFKSHDMVHWQQIGHVIDNPNLLALDSLGVSEGIFAPTIRYNEHNDTFYVITTCVQCGGNFVVKSSDPESGVWSDPIWLPEVGGIDPSLFFDDDGSAYIVNNDAPHGEPRYEGHRAIWMHHYDTERDCVIGNAWVLVDGGVSPEENPIWIEGPHIYKINGKYYLMAAEGGTSINHSEVIFMSDNIEGCYVPVANNPILTQRDMPSDRPCPVTCTGHADLVQDANGDWWSVFLGCRPYPEGYYNTGRETFLLPVTMVDSVPVILEPGKAVPMVVNRFPAVAEDVVVNKESSYGGNFSWTCDFSSPVLSDRFIFVRNVRSKWYNIADGVLEMSCRQSKLDSLCNPHFVAVRQQHLKCTVSVDVLSRPDNNTFGGLAAFQNEQNYMAIGLSGDMLEAYRVEKGVREVLCSQTVNQESLRLSISADNETYILAAYDGDKQVVSVSMSGVFLSTDKAGGFVGTIIGMLAQEYLSSSK